MGPLEGEKLEISTSVSQNAIKNHEIWRKFLKNSSRGVLVLMGYPLRQSFNFRFSSKPFSTLLHDLKSVLWFKRYSFFSSKLVLKPRKVNLGNHFLGISLDKVNSVLKWPFLGVDSVFMGQFLYFFDISMSSQMSHNWQFWL